MPQRVLISRRVESQNEFEKRIDTEDREAQAVQCPLKSCAAQIGYSCSTEAGESRIRHCARLMLARKVAKE
jgi:hypothetical protein